MYYKCNDCGALFERPDDIGYGQYGCPHCKGDFSEVEKCKICGEYTDVLDMKDGICEDCIQCFKDRYRNEPAEVYELSKDLDTETIEVNPFIYSILDREQIEEILMKAILEAHSIIPIDCSEYFKFLTDEDISTIVEKEAE